MPSASCIQRVFVPCALPKCSSPDCDGCEVLAAEVRRQPWGSQSECPIRKILRSADGSGNMHHNFCARRRGTASVKIHEHATVAVLCHAHTYSPPRIPRPPPQPPCTSHSSSTRFSSLCSTTAQSSLRRTRNGHSLSSRGAARHGKTLRWIGCGHG